jgi:hypothetical protein
MTQREFTNITLLIIHRGKVQSPSGALVVSVGPTGPATRTLPPSPGLAPVDRDLPGVPCATGPSQMSRFCRRTVKNKEASSGIITRRIQPSSGRLRKQATVDRYDKKNAHASSDADRVTAGHAKQGTVGCAAPNTRNAKNSRW